jgi:predicted tellurium resistance membrane protein TerC
VQALHNARNWERLDYACAVALAACVLGSCTIVRWAERRSAMLTALLVITAYIASGMLMNHIHPEPSRVKTPISTQWLNNCDQPTSVP